jgi:hypothetical protein
MDAIAHFHVSLYSNINSPRDFKCSNFQLFLYHCTSLQLKNYMILNNSEPVILTTNTETFSSSTLNNKNYNDIKSGVL